MDSLPFSLLQLLYYHSPDISLYRVCLERKWYLVPLRLYRVKLVKLVYLVSQALPSPFLITQI
jgi:hypothetical protein